MYTPENPSVSNIQVGFKRVSISRTCFLDGKCYYTVSDITDLYYQRGQICKK